jgi:hypothetical protein
VCCAFHQLIHLDARQACSSLFANLGYSPRDERPPRAPFFVRSANR